MVEEGDERMKIRISGQKKVAGYSGERRGRRKMKEKKRKRRREKKMLGSGRGGKTEVHAGVLLLLIEVFPWLWERHME